VVPLPTVTTFVDTIATNQRGDARYATLSTNAGVRVLGGFLDIWKPLTEIVDVGVTAPARDGFPAVVASSWSGVPNDGNADGKVVNTAVHQANIDYVLTSSPTLACGHRLRGKEGDSFCTIAGTLAAFSTKVGSC